MKNKGNTLILTNLVRVHPRNIYAEFEANPCSGLLEFEKVKTLTTMDSVIATVTH